jgi:hypothetical protein
MRFHHRWKLSVRSTFRKPGPALHRIYFPDAWSLGEALSTEFSTGVLAIAFFAVSAGVSFFGFSPQWKHETGQGVIFWRSILSKNGAARYQEELKKDLPDLQAVEDAYAEENYRVCNNFAAKNMLVQISIVLFVLGSLLALVSLGMRDVGMVPGTH